MFIVQSKVDRQQSFKRVFHVVLVSQCKVAQYQVQPGTERRFLIHYVLKRGHRVTELTQFHKRYRYVLHYFHPVTHTHTHTRWAVKTQQLTFYP